MKIIKTIPKFGDVSWDVVIVQEQLYDMVSGSTTIDGIFGRETEELIIEFQKKNGIQTNYPGTLGPVTLKMLDIVVVAMNPVKSSMTKTQDLKGKKDRHIHPSIRVSLEAELFPGGKILDCFKKRDVVQSAIAVFGALGKIKIFEGPRNNYGTEVGWVQGTIGAAAPGGNGDDWCLDHSQIAVGFLEDYFKVESAVPATAHTLTCWKEAKLVPGLTTTEFEIGTIAIFQRNEKQGHSMGVVADVSWDLMRTVEGNVDGKAGFFIRNKWQTNDLKLLGHIRFFPNNEVL